MDYIYEVRQSNKHWSAAYCFTFTKESAEHIIEEVKDSGAKNNYRIIRHECYHPKDLYFSIHTEYNIE